MVVIAAPGRAQRSRSARVARNVTRIAVMYNKSRRRRVVSRIQGRSIGEAPLELLALLSLQWLEFKRPAIGHQRQMEMAIPDQVGADVRPLAHQQIVQ